MEGTSEKKRKLLKLSTTRKVSEFGVFSGPYFLIFVMNMGIYSVNLRV